MMPLLALFKHDGNSHSRLPKLLTLIFITLVLNGSATFGLQVETRRTPPVDRSSRKVFANQFKGRFEGLSQTRYLTPITSKVKKIQSPLFQSSECRKAEAYPSRGLFDIASENLANLHGIVGKTGRVLNPLLSALTGKALVILQKYWWCLPMSLALVPPYFYLIYKTHPSMPAFWPLVKLDSVFHSPYAAFILGVFLLSNIAYFVSGAYLYLRYYHSVPSETSEMASRRDPLLGCSVLTAGTVSTVFHSVQALGPQSLAECLCYIDHGVAISSVFYFWYRCGRPNRNTWLLSLAGLATLSITEGYAWLHSAWHLLSASAAVVWARDGLGPRKTKPVTT